MNSAEPFGSFNFFKKKKKSSGKTGKSAETQWKSSDPEEVEDHSELPGVGIQRYDYTELYAATQCFSDACMIGRGSSNGVYRGMLKGQQPVAIKLLSTTTSSLTQVNVLSQLHHRNVVQLLGCCNQDGRLALVFEFVPNGVLFDHLYGQHDLPPLSWKVRYWRVAVGLASALLYLHEGLERCMVHRDIKPANILLDSDFNPKLAGFRLAIVAKCGGPEPEFPSVGVTGTVGYLDPQYRHTRRASKAIDIYAFGVVALQIAKSSISLDIVDNEGSKKNLIEWVEELHEKGTILEAVDPKFRNEINEREVERLLLVALMCTQQDAKLSPSIKLILQLLNFEVPMPSRFTSNVSKTLTEDEAPSSPKLCPPEVIITIDAPTTSTTSTTDSDTFKDIEADVLLLESSQDNHQEDDITPALSPEHASFDIGIPPDFGLSKMSNDRIGYHRDILKGFVDNIHEMTQSEEKLPRFNEALEKIKTCTSALVLVVGPPLDDWNTLAQLVLRFLKGEGGFLQVLL